LTRSRNHQVTADHFRALAARCADAGRRCSDLFAKEEFRRLAQEFSAEAAELERSPNHDTSWRQFLDLPHATAGDR